MAGNPNHGKDGKFSSGHNAGEGNRVVAKHIADQHIALKLKNGSTGFGVSSRDSLVSRRRNTLNNRKF